MKVSYRIAKSIDEKSIDDKNVKGLTFDTNSIDSAYSRVLEINPNAIIMKVEELEKKDFEDVLYTGQSEIYISEKYNKYLEYMKSGTSVLSGFFDKEVMNKINTLRGA